MEIFNVNHSTEIYGFTDFISQALFFFPFEKIEQFTTISNRIMPILFGFIIATIAIIASFDTSYKSLSADALQLYRNTFTEKILLLVMLGYLYFFTLALGIVVELFVYESLLQIQEPITYENIVEYKEILAICFTNIFLFFSFLSKLLSISFPYLIYKLHIERYDTILRVKEKLKE